MFNHSVHTQIQSAIYPSPSSFLRSPKWWWFIKKDVLLVIVVEMNGKKLDENDDKFSKSDNQTLQFYECRSVILAEA